MLVVELGKLAAYKTAISKPEGEKQAVGSLIAKGVGAMGRLGSKLVPKSTTGKAMAGLGAAGGMHLGQDAARSHMFTDTADKQRYWDQNQFARKAIQQADRRLSRPTQFTQPTTNGYAQLDARNLLGNSAPQHNIEAGRPGLLGFLSRPYHTSRMETMDDPGTYQPPAVRGQQTVDNGGHAITNPDGTVTRVGPAVAPTTSSQHTNASRFAKWQADMERAEEAATQNRLGKMRDNIGSSRDAWSQGSEAYAQRQAEMAGLWRQLGLDPSVMPKMQPTDLGRAEDQAEMLRRISDGSPAELGASAARSSTATDRKLEVTNWLRARAGLPPLPGSASQPQASPSQVNTPAPDGSYEAMQRRRNRSRDLARTWNAY